MTSRARHLATALACALLSATAPALASDDARAATATPPCVDLAGVVTISCPSVALPAVPKPAPPKPRKARGCANATALPTAGNLRAVNAATLCLVNRERTKRRLVPLRRQPTLGRAATRFAGQLVRGRFFDHTAPDGTTMVDRVKAAGYLRGALHRWWVGENIAYGTGTLGTPKEIVASWMRSPGHRANILQRRFREIGLGVSVGSPDGPAGATYVHDFGRRIR